ncbi:MAG: hypothetical protein EOO68_17150, partial [Moraxellaceae bacterium]
MIYFLDYNQLSNGGDLNFSLSAKPALKYLNTLAKPVMHIKDKLIVPNPIIDGPQETFKGSALVTLSCAERDVELFFTTDGTEPSKSSQRYNGPIQINKSTVVKAIGYKTGYQPSYVGTANYRLMETNYTIQVNSEINKSYTGGGNDALVDGLRGEYN